MRDVSRRRFLVSTGAASIAGLAGCSGGDGGSDGGSGDGGSGDGGSDGGSGDGGSDGGSGDTTASDGGEGTTTGGGGELTSVRILHPEGVLQYPMYEAGLDQGFWEEEGIDLTVDYAPFPAQVQSLSNGEVEVSGLSMIPYMSNFLKGEDVVTFGFSGCLQAVNGLYTRASSDYQSPSELEGRTIGVWSFGSSTVQSFQAILAEQTGLQLREDFQTTTAAPPALLGLLTDEEIDGVVNISGLTVEMESKPDTFRRLMSINNAWNEMSGNYLPITSWFASADWYEQNTEAAAALLRGSEAATQYWRENTVSILEEYGEPAGITNQAKTDVVDEFANQGQVFQGESLADEYVSSVWDFVELMNEYEFIESVPSQDEILRNPL